MSESNAGNGMLFITGDDEVSRYVYETYDFAYWTSAFDILLQKHGFLDFSKSNPDVLESPDKVNRFDVLLISWLPEPFWKKTYLHVLATFQGLIFLEGPFPHFVDEFLRKKRIRGKINENNLQFVFQDKDLVEVIKKYFPHKTKDTVADELRDSIVTTVFAPKKVETRPTESALRLALQKRIANCQLGDLDSCMATRLTHDVAFLYNLNSKLRFSNNGFIYSKPLPNTLAMLAWLNCTFSIQDDYLRLLYSEHSKAMLQSIDTDNITICDNQTFIECSTLCLVNSLASSHLKDSTYMDRACQLYNIVANYSQNHKLNIHQKLWQLYLMSSLPDICLDRYSEFQMMLSHILNSLSTQKTKAAPLILWLLSSVAKALPEQHKKLSNRTKNFTSNYINSIVRVDYKKGKLISSVKLHLIDLFQSIIALNNLSHHNDSLFILSKLFDNCFDQHKLTFKNATLENGVFNVTENNLTSPWVVLAMTDVVQKFDTNIPSRDTLDQYSRKRQKAWEAAPYWIQPYDCDIRYDPAYLWEREAKKPFSAISQTANIVTTSFQILSYLCHFLTIQPMKQPFNRVFNWASALVLELGFITFLKQQIAKTNSFVLKVGNWPWGKTYCLTIRHDVDRILPDETFNRLLSFEVKNQLGVSWFWLPNKLNTKHVNDLEKRGHEIGLHCLSHGKKQHELNTLMHILKYQRSIFGEFWHGGDGDNWLGHPSVHCAVDARLLYTEGPKEDSIYIQYGFPAIDECGAVYEEPIFIMPRPSYHDDVNINKKAIVNDLIYFLIQLGGHLILSNHPDINFNEFQAIVNLLPSDGRIDLTFLEACQWWNKTHRRVNLAFQRHVTSDVCEYVITSAEEIQNLELHVISDETIEYDFFIRCRNCRFIPDYRICKAEGLNVASIRLDFEPRIPLILEVKSRKE